MVVAAADVPAVSAAAEADAPAVIAVEIVIAAATVADVPVVSAGVKPCLLPFNLLLNKILPIHLCIGEDFVFLGLAVESRAYQFGNRRFRVSQSLRIGIDW